jgi:hypothetical protein
MHVDTYFQPELQFNTARSAGNVISQAHKSPIEDANARGFGSFQSQPLSQQNVTGRGVWHDSFGTSSSFVTSNRRRLMT